jgi:S-DNA-T family DNA segregation ATPase FtsK/SpoIIIE
MRSGASAQLALTDTMGHGIRAFARRQVGRLAGVALAGAVAFGVASLATWNVADPSFSHATDNPVTNAMGYPGAVFSDIAIQFFGLSAVAALVPAVIWGFLLFTARGVDRLPRRSIAWFGFALLCAAITGCVVPPQTWPLPTGLGGVFGDMVLKVPGMIAGGYPTGLLAGVLAVAFAAPALLLFAYGSALVGRKNGFAAMEHPDEPEQDDADAAMFESDEDDTSEGMLALGAITHWWLSLRAYLRRHSVRRRDHHDGFEPEMEPRASAWRRAAERVESAEIAEAHMSRNGRARVEPEFFAAMVNERGASIDPHDDDVLDDDFVDDGMDFAPEPAVQRRRAAPSAEVQAFRSPSPVKVAAQAPRPPAGERLQREAQGSLIGSDSFEMPSLHFLLQPPSASNRPRSPKRA